MLGTESFVVKALHEKIFLHPPPIVIRESGALTGLLSDYSNQARRYDDTRAASPSVLAPLEKALAGAPGRRLLDIGGGTGNYALALRLQGWDPLVADRSEPMLERAADKGLATLLADKPFPGVEQEG